MSVTCVSKSATDKAAPEMPLTDIVIKTMGLKVLKK